MLRFWHELFAFYHTLTPAVSAFKKQYKTPLFAYQIAPAVHTETLPKKQSKHGNCLLFAFEQKKKQGGNVITVKSRYGWWCHAYWMAKDGAVYEFAPVAPHRTVQKLWHPLPPLVYEGRMRRARVLPQEAVRKISALTAVRPVPTAMPAPRPMPVGLGHEGEASQAIPTAALAA